MVFEPSGWADQGPLRIVVVSRALRLALGWVLVGWMLAAAQPLLFRNSRALTLSIDAAFFVAGLALMVYALIEQLRQRRLDPSLKAQQQRLWPLLVSTFVVGTGAIGFVPLWQLYETRHVRSEYAALEAEIDALYASLGPTAQWSGWRTRGKLRYAVDSGVPPRLAIDLGPIADTHREWLLRGEDNAERPWFGARLWTCRQMSTAWRHCYVEPQGDPQV